MPRISFDSMPFFSSDDSSSHDSSRQPRRPRLPEWLTAPAVVQELQEYSQFLGTYFYRRAYILFEQFEQLKDALVDVLYRQRGRYTRPFLHFGIVFLTFFVITFGPSLLEQTEREEGAPEQPVGLIQTQASAYNTNNFTTLQAEEVRQFRGGEVTTHRVQEGETLTGIAQQYGLDVSTVRWENDLDEDETIRPGDELRILPIDGVRHKVARGETIYTIAEEYGLDDTQAQAIVNYPFNEFLNDETFELATGQVIVVPDGVPQTRADEAPQRRQPTRVATTPDAGAVSATGTFVWPAAGRITQGYRFYHKAVDIANRAGGNILAGDAGTVTVAGWPDGYGYGNRVVIDHGNGYQTLYAHLSVIQVSSGQRVNRGDVIGQMGNTGRSTGTHLHFEIRQGGVLLNPLGFLN